MKKSIYIWLFAFVLLAAWSCNDDDDLTEGEIPGIEDVEIENFNK